MNETKETLSRLRISDKELYTSILKREVFLRIAVSVFVAILSTSVYFSYKDSTTFLIVAIVIVLAYWVSLVYVLNLKRNEVKYWSALEKELNNPRKMFSVLKYGKTVYGLEDSEDYSLTQATKKDFEIVDSFITEYKLVRQLLVGGIVVVIGGLLLMSAVEIFYNVFLRWLFGALITALILLMLYNVLKLFNNLPYKIIFINFEKYADRCFEVGALNPLRYKILKLYYNDYCSEPQFTLEDYNEIVADDMVDRNAMVVDYIKDINYCRFTALVSLGIGIACIVQYLHYPTLYSVVSIIVTLILVIFTRARYSDRSLDKYEDKLVMDENKLTAKIMKFLDEDYKAYF
ncbi:hypothetical protein [Paraclostridium bifermentans]